MKKQIIILSLIAFSVFSGYCQKTFYIVFDQHNNLFMDDVTEVCHESRKPRYEDIVAHDYSLNNTKFNLQGYYILSNFKNGKPVYAPEWVPLSFLNTVQYLDYDKEVPHMTREQIIDLYTRIVEAEAVYMLDRASIRNDSIEMVRVVHTPDILD